MYKSGRTAEGQKLDILLSIANEIAESNRLLRLDLEMKYKGYARERLYKVYSDGKGGKIRIPPEEKDKEEYKLEMEAIIKEFSDHAVEEESVENIIKKLDKPDDQTEEKT